MNKNFKQWLSEAEEQLTPELKNAQGQAVDAAATAVDAGDEDPAKVIRKNLLGQMKRGNLPAKDAAKILPTIKSNKPAII